jgi:riboflavin kinase/FMN adenylyltransferase
MRLINGLVRLRPFAEGCVATIGTFDGVHLGHQAVIENLAREGHARNLPVVVVLFEPQPREYFCLEQAPVRLSRLREKLDQLGRLPVDQVLLLRFNRKLADSSADEFLRDILVGGLRVRHLVVGDDFRFGRGREGDFPWLRRAGVQYGFSVADTGSVEIAGERVSSTAIREALVEGDLAHAQRLLGRPYALCGRITGGARLGHTLGFPTANIALQRYKSPLTGVFNVTMTGIADTPLPGVANVGVRPTVDQTPVARLEVHLLDFDGDLYGKRVSVQFHSKIREERRFENLGALVEQIGKDVQCSREFFSCFNP